MVFPIVSKKQELSSKTKVLLLLVMLGFTAFLISCGSETEKSDEGDRKSVV